MSIRTAAKTIATLGALTLLFSLLAASAVAAPQLGVKLTRTHAPLHHGDERLVYEATVENEAGEHPKVGDELTCRGIPSEEVNWFGERPAPTFTYQWLRNDEAIAGATERTYSVTPADAGSPIQCVVSATSQATAAGTAMTEAGSNVITEVTTAVGSGTLQAGSKEITGLSTTSGRFATGQTVTGECIPPGTTAAVAEAEPDPVKTLFLAAAATCSGTKSLSAGPGGFGPLATISGPGIPPGTTITAAAGRNLTLSASATATSPSPVAISAAFAPISASAVSLPPAVVEPQPVAAPPSGATELQAKYESLGPGGLGSEGSVLGCSAPAGWTADAPISWSFQWLRNGLPAPHAPLETTPTSSKYELQEVDVEHSSKFQCEAVASAGGSKTLLIDRSLSLTTPVPPSPYIGPNRRDTPVIDFANQTSGPVALDLELPAGEETYAFKARGEGWICTKTLPSPLAHATVSCTREDPLSPQHSYSPLEVVAALGENPPDTLIAKAEVSGGNAPEPATAEDEYTIPLPALPFDFTAFETSVLDGEGDEFSQAGGHPVSAGASLAFATHERPEESALGHIEEPVGLVRTIRTDPPPGFIGNPAAVEELCPSIADVLRNPAPSCPAGSVVGSISASISVGDFSNNPIFAIEPEYGAAAEFAFRVAEYAYTLTPRLRPKDGYAISLVTQPLPKNPPLFSSEVTLCGFGAQLVVDEQGNLVVQKCLKSNDPGASEKPFLTLPTHCGDPASSTTTILADTWEGDHAEAKHTLAAPTGCDALQFEPSLKARPTTNAADSPSGLEVDLNIPQNEDPEGTATSQLKKAVVTLPEGLVVNPSGANGLGACSPSQVGLGNNDPVSCPDASKIGTVSVNTPILDHPLPGALYIATPHENPFNSLLALYLVVESPKDGLTIKLPGQVEANPNTGQLTTTFDQNPQAPVEDVQLKIRSGASAPLRTPATCAKYKTTSELTPWSAPESGPPATPSDSWSVSRGPGGGACASSQPNSPSFEAGTASPIGGAYAPFVLKLRREDGSQELSALTVTPPPGLLAKLAGTSPCSDAALASAASKSGKAEQESPSCPPASELGNVIAAAGAGPSPFQAQGKAYLAGPYKGAPLSLAVITPAVAGPFDLGTVVVRAAAYLDPKAAQITVKSDPLPKILDGIPLDVRSIAVSIDRPGFTLNPTSCDPMAVSGSLLSTLGQSASLNNRFQLGECSRLAFKPNLKLQLHGATKRGAYQQLTATVTAKPGEANIASASVTLPHSVFLAQNHIRTVCTRVQFAAHACPPGSIYGKATAITPLLDQPLSGPVYLRSSSHKLPDLVVALKGPDSLPVEVELAGRVDSVHGGIRNSFEVVPDAPVTKFTLQMQGAKKSLIVNSRNLCNGTQRATVQLVGQNGKTHEFRPVVGNGCAKGRGGGKRHKGKGQGR